MVIKQIIYKCNHGIKITQFTYINVTMVTKQFIYNCNHGIKIKQFIYINVTMVIKQFNNIWQSKIWQSN